MPVASLARILEGHWSGLIIGPPVYDQAGGLPNMVVYPLFPTELGPDPPDLISLSQGLRRGVRLRDTGMVGQVHVDNPLPTSVLVGESELLVGPTQRRAIQFSCLVPPHRRASLPVNCVEAGQPTVYQAQFTDSEACPWQLRSFKLEQLARHGETHQHRIWDRIDEYLKRAGTTSSSRDIGAVFGEFGGDLESLARAFPHHPSQVGAICAVGQELFVEVYDTPELLEDQYDRLLRSALVEAVAHPGREVVPPARVHELPAQLAEASVHSRVVPNPGFFRWRTVGLRADQWRAASASVRPPAMLGQGPPVRRSDRGSRAPSIPLVRPEPLSPGRAGAPICPTAAPVPSLQGQSLPRGATIAC